MPALNFIKVSLPESSLKGCLSSNRKQNKLKLTKQSFSVMTLRKKFSRTPWPRQSQPGVTCLPPGPAGMLDLASRAGRKITPDQPRKPPGAAGCRAVGWGSIPGSCRGAFQSARQSRQADVAGDRWAGRCRRAWWGIW